MYKTNSIQTDDKKLVAVFELGLQYGLDAMVSVLRSLLWFTRIAWQKNSRKELTDEFARGRVLGPLSTLILSAVLIGFLEDPAFVLSHLLSFVPNWLVGEDDKGNFLEKGYWYYPVASAVLAVIVGATCYRLAGFIEAKRETNSGLGIWMAYFYSGSWLWASIVIRLAIRFSGAIPWIQPVTINASTIVFWGEVAYVLASTICLGYSLIEKHARFGQSATSIGTKAMRVILILSGALLCAVAFELLTVANEWLIYRGLALYRSVVNDKLASEYELTGAGLFCEESSGAQGEYVACRTFIQNAARRELVLVRVGDLKEVRVPRQDIRRPAVKVAKAAADVKLPLILKPGTGVDIEFTFPSKAKFCSMFAVAAQDKTADFTWSYDIIAKDMNLTRADGEFSFGRWLPHSVTGMVAPSTTINSDIDCPTVK